MPAHPQRVWEVVGDPYHLPRWWPKVEAVEGVTKDAFTERLRTDKGRSVRADFRVLESSGPDAGGGGRRRWSQTVDGTPFERVLASAEVCVTLAPAEGGTRVELVLEQRMRGMARLGGAFVRRASKKTLDDALDRLAETF